MNHAEEVAARAAHLGALPIGEADAHDWLMALVRMLDGKRCILDDQSPGYYFPDGSALDAASMMDAPAPTVRSMHDVFPMREAAQMVAPDVLDVLLILPPECVLLDATGRTWMRKP